MPDQPRMVTEDAACVRCRYNLRNLPTDGDCPECGYAIALSISRELHHRDRRWLGRLALGVRLVRFFGVLLLAMFVVGCISRVLILVVMLLSSLTWAVAIWLMTSPEPGHHDGRNRPRWIARGLSLLLPAYVIVGPIAYEMARLPALHSVTGYLGLVFLACAPTLWFGVAVLAPLSRKTPEPQIALGLTQAGWKAMVAIVVCVTLVAGAFAIPGTQTVGIPQVLLVAGLVSLGLAARYGFKFAAALLTLDHYLHEAKAEADNILKQHSRP